MSDLAYLGVQTYHHILTEPTAPTQGQTEHEDAGCSPALAEWLAPLLPLPPYTLCLGFARDGLPYLVDLEDRAAGSMLVLADGSGGKTAFLRNLVQSAQWLNQPDQVKYTILANHPGEWSDLASSPYCAGCYHWDERAAANLLLDASALVENRRNGRRMGAAHLLILDSLAPAKELDVEVQVNLKWLVKNGPGEKVWTFGSLNPLGASDCSDWQALFRTWIFGHLEMPVALDDSMPDLGQLHAGQYCLQIRGTWRELAIPTHLFDRRGMVNPHRGG